MAPSLGIILLYLSLVSVVFPCNTWMQGIGTVTPNGDITEPEGETLKIDCTLNSTKMGNSSRLLWRVNGTDVSSEFIRIVDENTAQLTIRNTTAAHSGHYACLYNTGGKSPRFVCNNNVYIGFPPVPIENFTCTAYYWTYLTCTFNAPFNPVKVTYSMKIKTHKHVPYFECNMTKEGNMQICNFTKMEEDNEPEMNRENPKMRQMSGTENVTKQTTLSQRRYTESDKNFYIVIKATNKFGSWKITKEVDHFSRVLPDPIEDFSVSSLGERNVSVAGLMRKKWEHFETGLNFRLFYRSEWDPPDTWSQLFLGSKNYTTLENLHPNTKYTLKMQCRSQTAVDEKLWSANTSIIVQTLPDIPERPPVIIPGSFQEKATLTNRQVTLFWQTIPDYQRNAPNFKYCIEYRNLDYGQELANPKVCSADNYATIDNLQLENAYEFKIYSENEKGDSPENSVTSIDRKSKLPRQAETFTVIYFDHGIYEVSWQPPSHAEDIVNYTLFWCSSIKPHPFLCKGNLSWMHFDRDIKSYNLTMKNYLKMNYHFGISTNTLKSSSGLVWATCIVPYNGTLNRMKKVSLTSTGKDKITVSWKLDCSERIGIIKGFNIHYCEINSPNSNESCRDRTSKTKHVNGSHVEKTILTELRPFTFYKVSVSAVTRAGEGEESYPYVEATQESAPSEPVQNVVLSQGKNKTIVVEWDATMPPTGRIVKYFIYVNSTPIDVNIMNEFDVENKDQTHFRMTVPYTYGDTNYSIQFTACIKNNGCSQKSNSTTLLTEIGVPEHMTKPQLTLKNTTHLLISFEDPSIPNGPIDFYNLKIIRHMANGGNQTEWMRNITTRDPLSFETHCQESGMENSNISFAVQAVNVFNNTLLEGPFSEPAVFTCRIEPVFQIIIIAICTTVGIIVLILLLLYGYRRFKKKCWEIKNIKIHLPKGLEPESLKSPDFTSIQPQNKRTKAKIDARELLNQLNSKSQGSPRSRNTSGETRISSSSMDELIQNSGDGRIENVDNNSAMGSVSSTQTTRSNLSAESGNDLESLPPTTPDAVFAENPMLKRQSLPETDLNKMQPVQLEKNLLPNEIPNSYSKFACYFNDQNPTPNSGYLPTNASAPKSDSSAYVLPSSPETSVTPALPYSQVGMADATDYMNYPCTNLPAAVPSLNASSLPSYSVVGIADNPTVQMRQPINTAPTYSLQSNMEPNDNVPNSGLGYSAIGLAASSAPKNSIHPGYVAASIAETPAISVPIQNSVELQQPPLEPDSLEEYKMKASPSTKPYVPVASNIPESMYSRVSLQQPVMSNGYVPQSKMETDSIQIGKHSPGLKEKMEGINKGETSFIQPDSLETPSLSTCGSTNSKPSTPKKNGYVSLSMMDDPSLTNSHCSSIPEMMKTSQTSDEFDSPGPYSRVVSMNYDDASSNVTDEKS